MTKKFSNFKNHYILLHRLLIIIVVDMKKKVELESST